MQCQSLSSLFHVYYIISAVTLLTLQLAFCPTFLEEVQNLVFGNLKIFCD